MIKNNNKVIQLFPGKAKPKESPAVANEIARLKHSLEMLETQINNIELYEGLGKKKAIEIARFNLADAVVSANHIEHLHSKNTNVKLQN